MAKVSLKNVSGRMLALILTGAHLGATPHGPKPVKLVTVHATKSGQLVPRFRAPLMPTAIRIPAGESVDVDELVAHCPEIKKAIARGAIKKIGPTAEPAAVAASVDPEHAAAEVTS